MLRLQIWRLGRPSVLISEEILAEHDWLVQTVEEVPGLVPRKKFQARGQMSAGSEQRGGYNHNGKQQKQNGQNRSAVQCYSCGQYEHYAGQCSKTAGSSTSKSTGQSVNQRSNQAQRRGGSSGARGGRGGNRQGGRRIRFLGLNVEYDAEGYKYQVDDDGNIVLGEEEDDAATLQQNIHKKSGN